jgi:hypothetical protein
MIKKVIVKMGLNLNGYRAVGIFNPHKRMKWCYTLRDLERLAVYVNKCQPYFCT